MALTIQPGDKKAHERIKVDCESSIILGSGLPTAPIKRECMLDHNGKLNELQHVLDDPVVLDYARNTGPRLTPTVRAVFVEMARYVDRHTGTCSPTQEQIAQCLESTRETVINAQKDLEGLGLIGIRALEGAPGKRNEYDFTGFESGWEPAPKNPREKNQLLASYRLQAKEHRAQLAQNQVTIDQLNAEIAQLRSIASGSSPVESEDRTPISSDPAAAQPVPRVDSSTPIPMLWEASPGPHDEAVHPLKVGQSADIETGYGIAMAEGSGISPVTEANGDSAAEEGSYNTWSKTGEDTQTLQSLGQTEDLGRTGLSAGNPEVPELNVSTPGDTEVPGAKAASVDLHRAGDEFAGEIAGHGLLEANDTESLSRPESGQIPGDVAAPDPGEELGEAGQPPEASSDRTSETASDPSLGDCANEDGLNETIDPVPPPANVAASLDENRHVVVSWNAMEVDGITGYEVWRKAGGFGRRDKHWQVAGRDTTAQKDDGVAPGSRLRYLVRGMRGNQPGEWSVPLVVEVK